MGGHKTIFCVNDSGDDDFADEILEAKDTAMYDRVSRIYRDVNYLIERNKYYNEPIKLDSLLKVAEELRRTMRFAE